LAATENTATEAGHYTGTITWGANQKGNLVNEAIIEGYQFMSAHDYGHSMNHMWVDKHVTADECCEPASYSVQLTDACLYGAENFLVCVVTTDHWNSGAPRHDSRDFYNGCQHVSVPWGATLNNGPTTASAERVGSNIVVLFLGIALFSQLM
jgi:hypothetical protein